MMKICVIVVVLLGCAAHAAEPAIRLVPATKDRPAEVEVTGIDPVQLARLKENPPADWTQLFTVRVGQAETAMLGSYRVTETTVRFEPRFPLVAGLSYRVSFKTDAKTINSEIRLPKPKPVATTMLEQVYPSAGRLPENQLKFYFHFSAPMSRGEAYSRIHLMDANGKEVERPFLELDEELWTPDGKRFTLFLHPGRVKRGLKPREELGPILEVGKRYTLMVDAGWPDENGTPLKAGFRKEFSAGNPDDEQPDPAKWKLLAPSAGKVEPLRVQFPKPLDHALLQRMLGVLDANGKRIEGSIQVSREETVWEFVPATPWATGDYRLAVNTALEDLAGNSIAKPFEIDVFRPVQREIKTQIVEVKFRVVSTAPRPTRE